MNEVERSTVRKSIKGDKRPNSEQDGTEYLPLNNGLARIGFKSINYHFLDKHVPQIRIQREMSMVC